MEKEQTRKRVKHLRVPVLPEEENAIKEQAKKAGMSIAAYLRAVGLGYRIKGIVDLEQIQKLAKINGDQGRLGGLLKLWLTDDEKVAKFGESTICALLDRIYKTQDELTEVMTTILEKNRR
jgi:hypothetical protein